ncbi:hypothetical protein HDV57DRAFT_286561 [Trichoderma longibrachiatum]
MQSSRYSIRHGGRCLRRLLTGEPPGLQRQKRPALDGVEAATCPRGSLASWGSRLPSIAVCSPSLQHLFASHQSCCCCYIRRTGTHASAKTISGAQHIAHNSGCCAVEWWPSVSLPLLPYLYGISKRLGQQCNSVLQDISCGLTRRRLAWFRHAEQSSAAASVVSSSPRLCPQQRAQAALSQIAKEARHGKPLVAAHPAPQALPSPKALHTSISVSYTTAATGASFADQSDVGPRPRLVFAQAEPKGTIRWSKETLAPKCLAFVSHSLDYQPRQTAISSGTSKTGHVIHETGAGLDSFSLPVPG